ncbi:hypothetical protein [Microbacterium galbinum]|uniref:hypothetical protein n=1 Tax=Microbacterium galbinum TaxID=2851646 RepID=UPI001FFC7FD4|nr:hypothetical protein [Microbacterium galbinum]MCK2029730.1 hypothetical protein [Microbacterium galbinum]
MTRLLRVDDATLAAFAVRSGSGRAARTALGAELDAAADVLLLGDLTGPGPDRTAAAGALLAITQRVVVVPIIGERQHPINLGRNISTLSNLHGRRIGLAGTSAPVLALISRLFESWPLDAMVGDSEAGVYVDDSRIVRISDLAFPSIGGPLTVPVDVADKPVTVLLSSSAQVGPGVDVVLDAAALPVWGTVPVIGDEGDEDIVGARTAFGLGASAAIAVGAPAFAGSGRFDQV